MTADLLFSWSGSIDRRQFWKGAVVVAGLLVVSAILEAAAPQSLTMRIIALLPQGVGLYITLALAIKRCRTIGRSLWWALLLLVPVANLAWFVLIGLADDQPADLASPRDAEEVEPPPAGVFGKAVGAAVLLWLLVMFAWFGLSPLLRSFGTVFDGGMFLEQISGSYDLGHRVLGWMLLVLALAGTVVFLLTPRQSEALAGLNPHRERLSVWPGLPVSLSVGILAAIAMVLFSSFPFATSAQLLISTVEQSLGGALPVAVVVPAVLAALVTRSYGSAAAVAAPVVLATLYGIVAGASIGRFLLALSPFFIVLAAVGFVAGTVEAGGRAGFRFGAGLAVAAVTAILLASGLTTPTETVALAVLPAILLGAFMRGSSDAFLHALNRAAVMLAALALAFAMAALLATALRAVAPQAQKTIVAAADLFPVQMLPWVVAALAAVSSALLTPVTFLAVSPFYYVVVMSAGYDPVLIGVPMVLAALSGVAFAMLRDASRFGGLQDQRAAPMSIVALLVGTLCATVLALLMPQIGQWPLSLLAY